MSNVKVSVIVPVYNTGEYLYKCIDSILGQTMKELELLLIDDGSTDGSEKICDFYSRSDARVKVIHKKNEGVSVARNIGITLAKGKYIGFVDSDDWIEPDMYEVLFEQAEKNRADVVMCDVVTVYNSGKNEKDTFHSLKRDVQLHKEQIKPNELREIAGSACRGLYSHLLLQEKEIYFLTGLPLSEDRLFNLYVLGNCKKYCYIKKVLYNRYVRKGSAVNKYYSNMLHVVNCYRSEVLSALTKCWNQDGGYKEAYNIQFINIYMSVVHNLYHQDCQLTFQERVMAIKKLLNDESLKCTLAEVNVLTLRQRLLKQKSPFLLLLYGELFQIWINIKRMVER